MQDDMYDPEKEAAEGNVGLTESVVSDDGWVEYYACGCATPAGRNFVLNLVNITTHGGNGNDSRQINKTFYVPARLSQ